MISLNSDKARTAYEKQHKYGSTSRWTEHTGFVPTDGTGFVATDGGHVEHTREVDELCACALLSLLGVGAFAAEPKLEAALVVPIIDKLRASCVAPTPGPALYELRRKCLKILETLAPRHAKAIVEAGGVDVAIDLLKQLKLPGSTAVRSLTSMSARNVCAFLAPLISAGPAYADAVRLELKEYTNHPESQTFTNYTHRLTFEWFCDQLLNAPGGPPEFMLD